MPWTAAPSPCGKACFSFPPWVGGINRIKPKVADLPRRIKNVVRAYNQVLQEESALVKLLSCFWLKFSIGSRKEMLSGKILESIRVFSQICPDSWIWNYDELLYVISRCSFGLLSRIGPVCPKSQQKSQKGYLTGSLCFHQSWVEGLAVWHSFLAYHDHPKSFPITSGMTARVCLFCQKKWRWWLWTQRTFIDRVQRCLISAQK